jgi:hypothetical protein
MRPPCASTIDRQVDGPIPMPLHFVVKKDAKMRSAAAASSPTPVSGTVMLTLSGSTVCKDIVNVPLWSGSGLLDVLVARRGPRV